MKLKLLHEILQESKATLKGKIDAIAGGDAAQAWRAPTKFKKGDKFKIKNNGQELVIEVIDASNAPSELEISTTKNGKTTTQFTDALELTSRLRYCEKYEKL